MYSTHSYTFGKLYVRWSIHAAICRRTADAPCVFICADRDFTFENTLPHILHGKSQFDATFEPTDAGLASRSEWASMLLAVVTNGREAV